MLQSQHEKYVANVQNKEDGIGKESKIISKKIKEAKKLEKMEVQVLERLKQTYAKQQEAIQEIQSIFQKKNGQNDSKDEESSELPVNTSQ